MIKFTLKINNYDTIKHRKISKDIGYDIGMSNDQIQSDLLNGFCKALYNSMQENNRHMQICYIVDKLDKPAIEIIKDLMSFIELKEKESNK